VHRRSNSGRGGDDQDRDDSGRLFVYNGGFLTQTRVRRILELSGWRISLGKPGPDDWIGTWGKSPTAPRGEAVAARTDAPVLRVEDAFLRSIHPGRTGEAPRGLCLDRRGVHFDSSHPSDLEHLLATHPLDDTALLNRARAAIGLMSHAQLSKYNAFDTAAPLPQAPYVLVIDQTRGDASIEYGAANAATFREMLVFAQTENPGARVVIKTHPETTAGLRDGHFNAGDANQRITVLDTPVSPQALFQGATAVYTVSSQLGFEAIFAGHRPRVFGQPFYAGWGLTQDENPVARRTRRLTRAQLFAAAMILYPTWYDPHFDRLCQLEDVITSLAAQARAWREDRAGYVATGISRWKRRHLRAFFGQYKPLIFQRKPARAATRAQTSGRAPMVWASRPEADALANPIRIEDGFIRSRGLGANLITPLSLVTDDLGIYYEPARESRLERLIAASCDLPPGAIQRAETLIATITQNRISKYNLPASALPNLPDGHRILVPGQVEDDASIRLGCPTPGPGPGPCPGIATNLGLLERTRAANPDAVILYKPHPDVQAGLRPGALGDTDVLAHADMVLADADPVELIEQCDEVWTLTSLIGFEALLRQKPVTCLGIPFYAGWGLTRDLCATPERRRARPSLAALAHATLIDYARYHDMTANLPCTPEAALRRLSAAPMAQPRPLLRLLTRLQNRTTPPKP
jgi:capsular polysaccharide export protein